jgi:hypothetical protein
VTWWDAAEGPVIRRNKTGRPNQVADNRSADYNLGLMAGDLIFYQFSRSKVEHGDFNHFLSLYGPDKLPTGPRLREMMNRFVFCIDGYDDDPREIHLIPEVRRFYSAFHEAWPYWLYFCNLDVDTLRSMVMCCLPDVSTLQVDGKTKVAVTFDPLDVLNFIKHDFMPMNLMCDRAEMFERGIYDRTKAVFEHFNLPFDAEPPLATVHDDASQSVRRTGRNDPCPCGSGKKYKKCCGKG